MAMARMIVLSAIAMGFVWGCKKLDDMAILDKYGSDGGELFGNVFNISAYGFAPLDVDNTCCLVDANRFAGALESSVPGLNGHVLQVRVNNEASSYMTGTKVVRILVTDTGVVKVREYTLFDHGGYYRRSRFYQFSCDVGVTQIRTSESDANSKASFGLTKAIIGKDDIIRQKKTKSDGPQLFLHGQALETIGDAMALDRNAIAHVALINGGLNMSYYFATSPFNYNTPNFGLQLQEDRMETVITLDLTGRTQFDNSPLELEYTVYAGSLAELIWNSSSSTLSVIPHTSDKQALPELTEIYAFANTVACIRDMKSTALPISLSWKKTKLAGSVVIAGTVRGVEACDSVIWDPTNADIGEGRFEIINSAGTLYAEGAVGAVVSTSFETPSATAASGAMSFLFLRVLASVLAVVVLPTITQYQS